MKPFEEEIFDATFLFISWSQQYLKKKKKLELINDLNVNRIVIVAEV